MNALVGANDGDQTQPRAQGVPDGNCRSIAPQPRSRKPSTAVDRTDSTGRFRITHPFHPDTGREFGVVTWRHNWSEDRVYFHDEGKKLRSVPSRWTSLVYEDPVVVVVVSAGRAHFRFAELVELATVLRELRA